jgi:hypothetical protein
MIEIKNRAGKVIASYPHDSLAGLDLRMQTFESTDLVDHDFQGSNLSGSEIIRSDAHRLNMQGVLMVRAKFERVEVSHSNLQGLNLDESELYDMVVSDSDMRGAGMSSLILCRATFICTDLRDVDFHDTPLEYARFCDCIFGNTRYLKDLLTHAPLHLNGLHWPVAITDNRMKIGCRNYTHKIWRNAQDDWIASLDTDALAFWRTNREVLLALCHAHAQGNQSA